MYSVEALQKIINTEIENRSEEFKKLDPIDLYRPIEYSLKIGGKRLRPVLLLLSYNLFSEKLKEALPSAIAIEIFHNFTLLHDDIMDNAEVRRNQPTVYKKFNENSAILSGDAMAFLAYKFLLEKKTAHLVDTIELFSKTAIEVCEGQQFDIDFESRLDVTESEYLNMIRLKTAVLLACSLKAGALLANANAEIADQLYEYGINLGIAFQLQDDMLDSFGNQKTFGKKIGGDILSNKKTYLLIKALENAPGEARNDLLYWINKKDFVAEEKIEAVKKIYSQLDIKNITQQKVEVFFNKASLILQNIPLPENKKQPLLVLSNQMLNRIN